MSSKRNQTIAIARFLMYKYGLNQQLEGMTDEEYLAHPIGLDVGQYVADLMKYCPEHIVDQVMEHQDALLLGLDSDTFYIYHVAAVMVDNLRRLLLGINLSDKAIMDFDFPGVGFPV